jgi:hypothetical protein
MTTADSPFAPVVGKAAEAMHGTYRSCEEAAIGRIDQAEPQLPPHHTHRLDR